MLVGSCVPRFMANAISMLGRVPDAATARLTPKVRRRRSRSSSASSAGSSDSARATAKKKWTTGRSGKAALSADAAEALNKARAFIEVTGGDGRGRGAAAAAAAALPMELRSLVQRALTADCVNGKSEQRSSRRELPLVVQRLREGLEPTCLEPTRDVHICGTQLVMHRCRIRT